MSAKNSENQRIRKICEKARGHPRTPEPETIGSPDFEDLTKFLFHIDMLVADENIDAARKEIQKLFKHLRAGPNGWHLSLLPIDRHLYAEIREKHGEFRTHSIQSFTSIVLRGFLMECFLTKNNPKAFEDLDKMASL